MGKNKKKKLDNKRLVAVIYQSIYDIVDDETHNPSYRKYFDKVLKDIFGYDGLITSMMMATNQFKFIEKILKNDEYKDFCQMMLREEDVKSVRDLVRVAYDAAQIANKPKKSVSSKDIKAYRYLVKLYTQGIKAMRKKYKVNEISKKAYKNKYSDLNKMLGKNTSSYKFDLGYMDDNDESFGDLYEDDEDEDDNSQFDPSSDYDLDDLPVQFSIDSKEGWKPPKKSQLIIDGDETDLQLYDDSDEDEEEDTETDLYDIDHSSVYPIKPISMKLNPPLMPEAQFQRYSMSIFEKLLEHLEGKKDPQEEDSIEDKFTIATPVTDNNSSNETYTVTNKPEMENDPKLNRISTEDYPPENAEITATNTEETKDESDAPKKSYKDMTRKEIIDTFNSNNGVVNTASTEGEAEQ